jgi:acetyltransferase-like isoleucine patch superfamily enzyme
VLKLKIILAAFISILPINLLRVWGYRLLGYRIGKVLLGFGTVIAASKVDLGACKIGAFNLFVGPMRVTIGADVSIGNRNTFSCGFWTTREEYKDKGYARTLKIGPRALITSSHYFDLAGAFELGEGSWVAGMGSQFWTHGAGVAERDIRIGRDCYLGSAVRFAPGAVLGDNIIVALGSVVSGKFEDSKLMLGGVPAKVLKRGYDWKLYT